MQQLISYNLHLQVITRIRNPIEYKFQDVCQKLELGRKLGKLSEIIVKAEGAGDSTEIIKHVQDETTYDVRLTVLGHIQRGGGPSADDRVLATQLGAKAVEFLSSGQKGKMVAVVNNRIKAVDLSYAIKKKKINIDVLYRLIRILAL